MLKIHVLNVKLGDSIILETKVGSISYYSIIDCKSIEGKAPTVEFLRERGITRIQSLFLTHLHNDHYSGFPQLLDYLDEVHGSLEYFVSPQIPAEVEIWRKILQSANDQTVKAQVTTILKAMDSISKLPSATIGDRKVMCVRMVYEGETGERSWREKLHPALLFAPVSPTSQEAFQLVNSAFHKAALHNKAINAISHAFLIRYDACGHRHMGLFCGDLEGKTWRRVKNLCIEITGNAVRSELSFVKVPHHGAYNRVMEQCVQELVDNRREFVASISCPAASQKHPCQRTLEFLKSEFLGCCIACTNISAFCHAQGFPSSTEQLLAQSSKEAEFLEFALSEQFGILQPSLPGACAGDHTITITEKDCTLHRSTGLPCSFNPSGCSKQAH